MNKISHILLDIDGCITNGKNQPLDLELIQRLQKSIEERLPIKTSLCTGRSASYVEAISQMLHISDWCMCENGCYLYHPISDEIIYNPLLTKETIDSIHNIKSSINLNVDLMKSIKFEFGKEICLSINPIGNLSLDELYQIIDSGNKHKDIFISRSSTAVDITPKNINKGSLFDFWCDMFNLSSKNVLGVGDSIADMTFLSKCGFIACPSNAIKEIKNEACFISNSPTTLGLIDIYNNLEGIYHKNFAPITMR